MGSFHVLRLPFPPSKDTPDEVNRRLEIVLRCANPAMDWVYQPWARCQPRPRRDPAQKGLAVINDNKSVHWTHDSFRIWNRIERQSSMKIHGGPTSQGTGLGGVSTGQSCSWRQVLQSHGSFFLADLIVSVAALEPQDLLSCVYRLSVLF